MKLKTILHGGLLIFAMAIPAFSFAQVTTAALNGQVTEAGKEELIGASVKAVHQPSGTIYGITTRDDGSYTIPSYRTAGRSNAVVAPMVSSGAHSNWPSCF